MEDAASPLWISSWKWAVELQHISWLSKCINICSAFNKIIPPHFTKSWISSLGLSITSLYLVPKCHLAFFFEIYPYLALLAVLSFLLLNSNLLHGYSTIFFFIHLLMDILSYFQVITFINKGAMYVWVQVFMWKCIFFSLE